MPRYENCIHWRVCSLVCPMSPKECRHYRTDSEEVWKKRAYKYLKQRNAYITMLKRLKEGQNI